MSGMASTIDGIDALGIALGAPSRQVLSHAQVHGPKNGWKDGFLSSAQGFCPSAPEQPMRCLRNTLGAVWLDTCQRLPHLVKRRTVRDTVGAMPLISGTSDTIPDDALWAATAALAHLSATIRLEDGIRATQQPPTSTSDFILPKQILVPISEISKRLHQESSYGSSYQDFITAIILAQADSPHTWESEVHISTSALVELAVQCQELVIKKDSSGLTRFLLQMKGVVDDVLPVLSRIPPENLVKTSTSSLEQGSSSFAPNQLGLPLFQLLHTLIGEPSHLQKTSQQLAALRPCLPINIRAFLAALDTQHSISQFVSHCGNLQLSVAWEALGKSYYGSQGLLGLYNDKLLLWQNITSKMGQAALTPQDVNDLEQASLQPASTDQIDNQHFVECTTRAKVLSRSSINQDRSRATALVTLMVPEAEGLPFQSGDRLLVMPLNAWVEVEKIAAALGLESFLDLHVPLYGGTAWDQFARQLVSKQSLQRSTLSVKDVLRYGQIAPLTRNQIVLLDGLFHGTSPMIRKLLQLNTWPVMGTLGDVLQRAIEEVSPIIWDTIFDLEHLSWLTQMIPVGVPRVYGISSPALMGASLPSTVKITVSRVRYQVHPELDSGLESTIRWGMTSEALNPEDLATSDYSDDNEYPLLIGIAPVSTLRLRRAHTNHIIMFADSTSVGSFRSFWRSRSNCLGETVLFLTHETEQTYPYQEELQRMQQTGQIKVFAACASQTAALDKTRLLSSIVLDMGKFLYEMLTSISEGGLGGYFYVSGSMALYNSIITGLKRALNNMDWTMSHVTVDRILRTALNDGRVILDIHPDPMLSIDERHSISMVHLALHTGHRSESPAWLGINGHVYDLTEFCKLQPWHERTIRLQAGLDANNAVATLLGTNSELAPMLPSFRVARLASKPMFVSDHIKALHDTWTVYLRSSVESLTAFAFESERLIPTCHSWFGMTNNRELCFDFLGLQKRLLSTGVACTFGIQLQELHLRTAFAHVSNARPDSDIPDVMGIIARARSSTAASKSSDEFQAILKLSSALRLTPIQADSIVHYARGVALLELHLLETVRAEACTAVYLIESATNMIDGDELAKITLKLLSTLERIAGRYDAFWQQLALEGIGRSCFEKTQLRSKYDIVRISSADGRSLSTMIPHPSTLKVQFLYSGQTVSFAHLIDQAMKTVNEENLMAAHAETAQDPYSRGDASVSLTRGSTGRIIATAYDIFQHRRAVKSLTEFLGSSETAIKRLSQLPSDLSFAYIMATYGKRRPGLGHVRSESAAKTVLRTIDGQPKTETPRPRLIRRRTNASSISSSVPQSVFSTPEASTPETTASSTSSPALPFQLTLRARDRSSSKSASTPLKHMKGPLPVAVSHGQRVMPTPNRTPSVTFSVNTVSPQAAFVERPREQPRKAKPLPTLLPSPLLPDMKSVAKSAEKAALSSAVGTSIKPKRNIDQVYTFSVSDGPAAGRARTKQIDLPSLRSASRDHSDLSMLANEVAADQVALKFEAPKRSRTVERIFTHSHGESTVGTLHSGEAKKPKRGADQLYSFSVSDGPAAGRPRTKQVLPINTDPYVEGYSRAQSVFAHVAVSNEPAPKFTAPKRTRLVERIFTHSRPVPRIQPGALRKHLTARRNVDQIHSFSVTDGPAAGRPRLRQVLSPSVVSRKYDQEYINQGAMELQARLTNPTKSLRATRTRIVESIFTHSQSERHHLPSGPETQSLKPRAKEVFPLQSADPRHPIPKTSYDLWSPVSDTTHAKPCVLPFGQRRTLGYIGMWMRPASRIQNVDFEELREQTRQLGPYLHACCVANCPSSQVNVAVTQGIWAPAKPRSTNRGFTLGSVGLWMDPPSKKTNIDFEQAVVNTMNYLLGSKSVLLQRMTKDFQLTSAHLQKGSWSMTDWAQPGTVETQTRSVVVLDDLTMPVQPARYIKPRGYAGRTLGQIGMWMYPASKKRNLDFEAYKAIVDSAPEAWSSLRDYSQASVQPLTLRGHRIVSRSQPVGYTQGSVGLWMNPPSKKINEDFESAKEHAQLAAAQNADETLQRFESSLYTAEGNSVAIHSIATTSVDFRHLQTPANAAFQSESPTLPHLDVFSQPALTPASATSADDRIHRGIDFNERLKRLNLELDFGDSDLDGETAMNTPTSPAYHMPHPSLPLEPQPPMPSKRPPLEFINTQANRRVDEHGLEILSAVTYTPKSASAPSASLLTPPSAPRHQSQVRPARSATRALQTEPLPPMPSQSDLQESAARQAPLRSQSVKQPQALSRVNSVRDMWEKRASLVIDGPVMPPAPLRSRTKSPPKPLDLQRKSPERWMGMGMGMGEDGDEDSATLPSSEFEMVDPALLRGDPGAMMMMMSPLSPGVRAY